ncbi:MAG: TldD/PmbA family protein [bacterium]
MDFDAVISLVNDYSKKKGIKFEAYLFNSKLLKMESENSSISNYVNAETNGLDIRLYDKKRVSFSYCLGLEEQKILNALDGALSLLKFTDENDYSGFAEKDESISADGPDISKTPEKLGIYSEESANVDLAEKKSLLTEMEETAYSYDKKIYKVDKPTYSETLISKRFCNSNGVDLSSKKSFYEIFLSVAARAGEDNGSGFDFDFSHSFRDLKFKKAAMNAAKRGVDQLGARAVSSGNYNILFDNFTSSELLSILKQSFYANNVYKKKSLLEGRLGEKVFSEKINIIDDGLLYGGALTDIFDREGVKMQKNILCSSGVVNSYLYDIEYANRFGVKSTGNSVSHSFTLPPDIGSSNFFIKNGETNLLDVINSIKEGLYINELMGLHMAKPYTGEFSLGASGFYIKNGKIDFPVKGIVLSGNLMQLFNGVLKIADDIRFFGSTGSPSILFENVQVSGK